MKVILLWLLDILCGLAALLGALLVGWNSIEVYYLAIGRIQPDYDQPPLAVVVPLLLLGLFLLFAGRGLNKQLRKDNPF